MQQCYRHSFLSLQASQRPVKHHASSHEVNEGWWQEGNEQGSYDKGPCYRARAKTESLLRGHQQSCCDRNRRSQEERSVYYSRSLPLEDEDQARHQSRREDHVRQGDQGEGKASQDHRQGVPSACTEEADLAGHCTVSSLCFSRGMSPWESHGTCLEGVEIACATSHKLYK